MNLDNLKVGRWVMIVRSTVERESPYGQPVRGHPLSGVPFRVRAISLPFVALNDVEFHTISLDTRTVQLSMVRPGYVNAYRESAVMRREEEKASRRAAARRRKQKASASPPSSFAARCCPNCGTPTGKSMIQLQTPNGSANCMVDVCPKCGRPV